MILKIEQNPTYGDIEVLITCPVKNKTVERIVSLIKSVDTQIECYSDDITKLVNVSDIYYIESVDGKTVVCCEKENYFIKSRLYQIYEKLRDNGFIQVIVQYFNDAIELNLLSAAELNPINNQL